MAVALRCEGGRGRGYAAGLRDDARRLMAACGLGACELSVVIASDEFVRALNRQYRGRDRATDVLSFSQLEEVSEPARRAALPRAARARKALTGAEAAAPGASAAPAGAGERPGVSRARPPGKLPGGALAGTLAPARGMPLGDVVISADTAERQARRLGVEAAARMRTLLVHGVLHLLGYDHERSTAEARRMFARERELACALAVADGASGAAKRARARRRPAPRIQRSASR